MISAKVIPLNWAIPIMEFRLIYDGPLPSDTRGNVAYKHRIRRDIHFQLAELHKTHPALRPPLQTIEAMSVVGGEARNFVEVPCEQEIGNFRFRPFVREPLFMTCQIDILFLRMAAPGSLVFPGGDIDNRIKVLLDGLCIPPHANQLPADESPKDGETPFYCLLQDDNLITGFSVKTDRLLTPKKEDETLDHARCIMDVTIHVTKLIWANMPYAGD